MGNNIEVSQIMLDDGHRIIDREFDMDLFITNMSETRDRITATEVLTRTQEQARVAGPLAARDEDQFQNTLVERELDILLDWGFFGKRSEVEFSFSIQFKSNLSFAQKADEVLSITRTLEAVQAFAQFDPSAIHTIDTYSSIEAISMANGTPARTMASREEFDAKLEQEAQDAQNQSLMENAGGLAQAAQTVDVLGGSPNAGAI
jgi:hypothetical protein